MAFSTNVTLEAFFVRRLPGSRTVRGLMITSGEGLFKGSIVLLLLRTPRLFRSNVLKLDGFFGVLFSSSLCRLTLLFCSVCVLLFHGHRHPDRVFWRDCCRVHSRSRSWSLARHPSRHPSPWSRSQAQAVSRLVSQSVTNAALSVVVFSSAIPNTIPTTVAGDLSAL